MKVEVYSKEYCPFCIKAKKWLKNNNIEFEEIVLDDDSEREKFYQRVGEGVRTVPQIFLNGERIGGYTELMSNTHRFIKMDL